MRYDEVVIDVGAAHLILRGHVVPPLIHVAGFRPAADGDAAPEAALLWPDRGLCECTGVPIVLNASFNENEPVVSQPSGAVPCPLGYVMAHEIWSRFSATPRTNGLTPQPVFDIGVGDGTTWLCDAFSAACALPPDSHTARP